MTETRQEKQAAAEEALKWIQDGMVVGLGSGSTATIFLELLAERVTAGLNIRGVPTSEEVAALARRLGVPVVGFDRVESIDVTIDGADEIDLAGVAIKGGGGALVREKIVATATRGPRIAVVHGAKVMERLGRFPLAVEVLPFAAPVVTRQISEMQAAACVREVDGKAFVTDNGNYILDCPFGARDDWRDIARRLDALPGIVGHGIFVDVFGVIIVGQKDGVRVHRLSESAART